MSLPCAAAAASPLPHAMAALPPALPAAPTPDTPSRPATPPKALALDYTAASRASLLSTFTVLAVPIIGSLSGQRIKPMVWAAAAAALAGTAMLEGSGGDVPPNVGDLWSVASAVLFAAQICAAERQLRVLPKRSELPLMAVSMATVAEIGRAHV